MNKLLGTGPKARLHREAFLDTTQLEQRWFYLWLQQRAWLRGFKGRLLHGACRIYWLTTRSGNTSTWEVAGDLVLIADHSKRGRVLLA